jgi:basic amino acid/polyamine antiporter, APA family
MALTTVGVLGCSALLLFVVYSRNTGHSFWLYWAPYFLAAGALLRGIPLDLAQRCHLTERAPVPPYR